MVPQEIWDEIAARSPYIAHKAATCCDPCDFEVLDLFALPERGTA